MIDDFVEEITNLRCENSSLEYKLEKLLKEHQELKENYERIYNENCILREKHNINDIDLLDKNQELKKQLHEASLTIQEMTEQDIECPSNCEKLDKLLKENQELKKQVEDYKKLGFKHLQDKNNNLETQEKEFINYLEDKIYSIEPKGTGINYNCEYDSEEDYVMAMQEQSRLNTLKEILQKYKSIIGDSK